MKAQGKTIVVTGGGNGLGREIVLHLLEKGSRVIALDINKNALLATKDLAKDKASGFDWFIVDVTDPDSIKTVVEKIISKYESIDGLVNNAGIIQPFQKFQDMAFDTIEKVLNVNFFGMLYMTKALLPYLQKRPEAHIINISSMGGFLPVAGQSIYGASKAAVKILSESLGAELSDTNINVTTVFPGAIFTNIKRNSGLGEEAGVNADEASPDMALSPVKAAHIIVNAMEEKQERIFVGKDSKVMNATYRLRPGLATRLIYKKMKHKI